MYSEFVCFSAERSKKSEAPEGSFAEKSYRYIMFNC